MDVLQRGAMLKFPGRGECSISGCVDGVLGLCWENVEPEDQAHCCWQFYRRGREVDAAAYQRGYRRGEILDVR